MRRKKIVKNCYDMLEEGERERKKMHKIADSLLDFLLKKIKFKAQFVFALISFSKLVLYSYAIAFDYLFIFFVFKFNQK